MVSIDKSIALKVYMLREDCNMSFIDIAKHVGGISGQDAARLWLVVKDARESFLARERVVYRKRHINKNFKPKQKSVDNPKNSVMMNALKKAIQ